MSDLSTIRPTNYAYLPLVRLRRREPNQDNYDDYNGANERQAFALAERFYRPHLFMEFGGPAVHRQRHFTSSLLAEQIDTIAGYIASPGHQQVSFGDASPPADEVVARYVAALAACREAAHIALLYGRAVVAVDEAGAAYAYNPKQIEDIYNERNELIDLSVGGEPLPDGDALPAAAMVLDASTAMAGQPYLARILHYVNAINRIMDAAIQSHINVKHKFFGSTASISDENKRLLSSVGAVIFDNLADNKQVFSFGDDAKDQATPAIVSLIYDLVERETGVINFNRTKLTTDPSGVSLQYRLQTMAFALTQTFGAFETLCRKIVAIVNARVGGNDPTITITKNAPRAVAEEVATLTMAGASRYTRLQTLGLDPEREIERVRQERDAYDALG